MLREGIAAWCTENIDLLMTDLGKAGVMLPEEALPSDELVYQRKMHRYVHCCCCLCVGSNERDTMMNAL